VFKTINHSRSLNVYVNENEVMRNETLLQNENFEIGSSIEIGPTNISSILPIFSVDKLSGKVTDFNIWNHTLTNDEIKRYVSECDESLFASNSLSIKWSNLLFPLNSSSITVEKISRENFYQNVKSTKVTKIFPIAVTFKVATEICQQMGGQMLELQNMNEMNRISECVRNSSVKFPTNTFLGLWQPIVRSQVSKFIN
jgi:hypothetical protein